MIPHPDAQNHNGGQLHFGPQGLLYASIGDGGHQSPVGEHARDLENLLGKLLRIDPHPQGGSRMGSRPTTRSSASPAGMRSSPTGSVTRGASPSTGAG